MAINKNHTFEDLEGIKCAIVETNVPGPRKDFIKELLEYNGFTVVVSALPVPPPPAATGDMPVAEPPPPMYKIGVTDVSFNVTNSIFGRLLHTKTGNVVTMAYWLGKEEISRDDIPYYERGL